MKEKFDAYSKSGKSLFLKLCEIIDDDVKMEFHYVCLIIIYFTIDELNNYDDEITFSIEENIELVLKMKNQEYKIEILKIFVVFWKYYGNDELKEKILGVIDQELQLKSIFKVSLSSINRQCSKDFFRLSILLKENRLKMFEIEFDKYICTYQRLYGEYWKVAMKFNSRLLYWIAESRKLLKTVEFILHKCSFIDLNSTIVTSFEEVAEFCVIFNEPLNEQDKAVLVSFQ